MILVQPQEQMPGGDEGGGNASNEIFDDVLAHLRQTAPPLPPLFAFVPVAEFVRNTAILRIEKGDGNRISGNLAEKLEAVHFHPLVEGHAFGKRNVRRNNAALRGKHGGKGWIHAPINRLYSLLCSLAHAVNSLNGRLLFSFPSSICDRIDCFGRISCWSEH